MVLGEARRLWGTGGFERRGGTVRISLRVLQGPSLCSAGNRAERKKQGDRKAARGPGDVRAHREIEVGLLPGEVAFSVPF